MPPPDESLAACQLAAYQPASFRPDDLSDTGSDGTSSGDDTPPLLPEAISDDMQISKGLGLVIELARSLAEYEARERQEIPLYAFLACFSRNYKRDCFKPVAQITQAYSATIKCYQFIILYWLHTDIFASSDINISMASYTRSWMHQWFIAQSETPLGYILVLRALGFAISKASTSLGKIYSLAPHTLRYQHITLSQQDLRVFLAKGINQLALALSNDLFLEFTNFQEVR